MSNIKRKPIEVGDKVLILVQLHTTTGDIDVGAVPAKVLSIDGLSLEVAWGLPQDGVTSTVHRADVIVPTQELTDETN